MSPTQPTVVVLHDGTHPPTSAEIEQLAEVRYATEDELADALPGADVLFVWHFLSDAVADAWPAQDSLRWVHIAAAGVEKLLFDGLLDSPATLTNSRGVFDRPMAEYVLGTVLTFAKDLHTSIRLQDEKHWRHRETERIHDKRALVVGTGPIGRAIAQQLTAAGLTVTGAGRVGRVDDADFGDVYASDQIGDILGEQDYVVLAAPLTDQTRHMINAETLARFKPTARLINVGRGDLAVQEDVVEALTAGTLAGAALDVFDTEPLPETSPLWEMPNVLVSPHMSGDTVGWIDELAEVFTTNLRRYLANETLHNVVDKKRGYVSTSGSEQH